VPNAIFARGCFDGAALVGSFTEGAPHGDNVVGTLLVGNRYLTTLSATDTNGLMFNENTGYLPFLLPPPSKYEVQLTLNFAANSPVDSAISLPFTILPASSSVPEPGSWVMISTAALAGLGCCAYRRRRRAS
jgi:hypothetical protein